MVQEWVYDASSAEAAPLRLNEASSTADAEDGVLVEVCYIALPAVLGAERAGEGGVITGPLVGTVRRSSHDCFAVGDWVFTHGPWRTEFIARPADLVKIDTQLDDPLSYLSVLRDDVVRLYATVQTVQQSNQDTACVLGADTGNGRIATALLKALGFQVLAVPEFAHGAAIVQTDNQADHVHPLANSDLATILRTVGVDKLKVCVDCSRGGSEIANFCNLVAQDGLIVSWTAAATADAQVPLSSLAEAQATFKAIKSCGPTSALFQARSVVRDIFRKHPAPNVVRVERGFERLASAFGAQAGSELVVLQVEPELPQPTSGVLPEAVELQRFIAEADIALRSVITDAALHKIVSQHQTTLRTKLQRLGEAQQQQLKASASKPEGGAAAEEQEKATSVPVVAEEKPAEPARAAPPPGAKFISIDTFAWDQGGYNSPTVTVYVDLPGVGAVKDSVHCHFDRNSFDLTVYGLNGKNYRLFKDNLEKDIVPAESKFTVKQNKVVVKLKKKKGEFSYEHWTNLTAKRKRDAAAATKDPMGGIMDLMRDMYDEGDDQTRKLIGEAMMKAQRGEKQSPPSFDDL